MRESSRLNGSCLQSWSDNHRTADCNYAASFRSFLLFLELAGLPASELDLVLLLIFVFRLILLFRLLDRLRCLRFFLRFLGGRRRCSLLGELHFGSR